MGRPWRAFYRDCLARRRRHVVPLLGGLHHGGTFDVDGALLRITWTGDTGMRLHLIANLGREARVGVAVPNGDVVYASEGTPPPDAVGTIPRCGVVFVAEPSR